MNKTERAAVLRLLRACQDVVNTKEYQRIHSMTIDPQSKEVKTIKGEFEDAAIAIATLIGCAPKDGTP